MGAGGHSGQLGFPEYIEGVHEMMLLNDSSYGSLSTTFDINPSAMHLMEQYVQSGQSPYDEETAYNPDSHITAMTTQSGAFKTLVDSIDPRTDWANYLAKAKVGAGVDYGAAHVKSEMALLKDNPAGAVSDVRGKEFTNILNALSTAIASGKTQVSGIIEDALSSAGVDDAVVAQLVDNYEQESRGQFFRNVNRFTGSMFMANAVHSTGFLVGMAHLEGERANQIEAYRLKIKSTLIDSYVQVYAQLLSTYLNIGFQMTDNQVKSFLQNYRDYVTAFINSDSNKHSFIVQAVDEMTRALGLEISANSNLTSTKIEEQRIALIAKKEEAEGNIEMDVLDANWPFDVLIKGGQIMSAIHGVPLVPEKPSRAQSAIGGAFSGAAAGVKLASSLPDPTGTSLGIGAVLGAGIGFGASLF